MTECHIGFSGSRRGMNEYQTGALANFLSMYRKQEASEHWFHQGICIGSDEWATVIALKLGFKIHGHPPIKKDYVSQRALEMCDKLDPEYSYSGRNQRIVLASQTLLATPLTDTEIGGTWNAIGHAVRQQKHRVIILPDRIVQRGPGGN